MAATQYLRASIGESTIPAVPLRRSELEDWIQANSAKAAWVRATGFIAQPATMCLLPTGDGGIERVLLGIDALDDPWEWAPFAATLPRGCYRIERPLGTAEADAAALGWALSTYRFDRYRSGDSTFASLVWPDRCNRKAVEQSLEATVLVRDLINTPASDLGPVELADTVRSIGRAHGGNVLVVQGRELLARNFPAIFAVGQASTRPPCLIDLTWGDPDWPRVTLVGKGVCFDTGGLDLKPSSAMKLMKKDMGGAAIMIGLSRMIMDSAQPVRLRLLVPAVENSVSGSAMRPLDVVRTRNGRTVEIGNTDAEGRVILADALAEAATEDPALLVDCATLTGAARTALGTELPALFSNDDAVAEALLKWGRAVHDPLWRLPIWEPYRRHIRGKVADLTNAPDNGSAGAIVAALFLSEFVGTARPWLHLDVMAWNTESRPGRPEGGEAMGMRALFALVSNHCRG
jgi:leucyl aminopeptidase